MDYGLSWLPSRSIRACERGRPSRPVPSRAATIRPVSVSCRFRTSVIQFDSSIHPPPACEEISASKLSDQVHELYRKDRQISRELAQRLYSADFPRTCGSFRVRFSNRKSGSIQASREFSSDS